MQVTIDMLDDSPAADSVNELGCRCLRVTMHEALVELLRDRNGVFET